MRKLLHASCGFLSSKLLNHFMRYIQ